MTVSYKKLWPRRYNQLSRREGNDRVPNWKTVLPGSAKCLDSEDFISKIFKILFGNGNFSWFKYVSRHQRDFFLIFYLFV